MPKDMDKKMRDLVQFGSTWWGKRWIESMLKFGRFYRMQRGINYAKDGRVSDLIIKKGEIFAQCQGTAPVPYRVKVHFDVISDENWEKIAESLSKKAIFEAELLCGVVSKEFNLQFQKLDIPLFPKATKHLTAECNCPDQEVPCKHIAAVILSLAKIFDYDPFMLVKLRGLSKEELLNKIESYKLDKETISPNKKKSGNWLEEAKTKKLKEIQVPPDFFKPDFNDIQDIDSLSFDIKKHTTDEFFINKLDLPDDIEELKLFGDALNRIYTSASNYAVKLMLEERKK